MLDKEEHSENTMKNNLFTDLLTKRSRVVINKSINYFLEFIIKDISNKQEIVFSSLLNTGQRLYNNNEIYYY